MLITSSIKFNLMMKSTLIIIKLKKMCYLMMDEWHSSTGGLPGVVTGALDFDGLADYCWGRGDLRCSCGIWYYLSLSFSCIFLRIRRAARGEWDSNFEKRKDGEKHEEMPTRRNSVFWVRGHNPPPPTRAGAVLESRLGITCGVPVPTDATNS